MTIISEQVFKQNTEPKSPLIQPSLKTAHADNNQLLLNSEHITHHPKSGLNPLVDAASYIFSIVGKLKQLKTYRHLNQLQKELVYEIKAFQETTKVRGYSSEYILVCRYALCATLDDIISNTLWGSEGQWDTFSMLTLFNQETPNHDRFFIILERIIKDPAQYIDVMELMYLCLSLGFKGNYRTTEFGSNQLEQIATSLYKRIRAHRGDFSKILSPYPIRPYYPAENSSQNKLSLWIVGFSTISIILAIFLGLGYMLDTFSKQAYQELTHIGKSILYETDHS